jgi:hypothetical protein
MRTRELTDREMREFLAPLELVPEIKRREEPRPARSARARPFRLGLVAASLATGGILAITLWPNGTPAGGPRFVMPASAAPIVSRAAEVTSGWSNQIVRIRSSLGVCWGTLTCVARDQLDHEQTTWVRYSSDGEPITVRELQTGGHLAGDERVTTHDPNRTITMGGKQFPWEQERSYDSTTGKITTEQAGFAPSVIFKAHGILEAALRGSRDVRLAGRTMVDGHDAYRLVFSQIDESSAPGERNVLYVNAETYLPVQLDVQDDGPDMHGNPSMWHLSERVNDVTVLPDSAANRKQLEMHGPTG